MHSGLQRESIALATSAKVLVHMRLISEPVSSNAFMPVHPPISTEEYVRLAFPFPLVAQEL